MRMKQLCFFIIVVMLCHSSFVYARGKPPGGGATKKLDKWSIVVVPGHGGTQVGAVGKPTKDTMLFESEVNLAVAKKLADKLASAGANAYLTRSYDEYMTLEQRASYARNKAADRFISVHHNSVVDQSINGTEVWICNGTGLVTSDMANRVYSELSRELGVGDRGVRTAYNNGEPGAYSLLSLLRDMRIPAILTEASFISNPAEANRLKSDSYRDREASAIYRGIISHAGAYARGARDGGRGRKY